MGLGDSAQRLPTGVPGLDEVLGGPLPGGDLLFIIGVPGAGKTVLALQIGYGCIRNGGNVLLLTSFSEGHDKLIAHLRSFDFFDPMAIGQQIQFMSILTLLKEGVDETMRAIARTARQQNINLIIIDGFRGIRDAFPSDMATRQFLQTLGTQLAYLGTTLIITVETDVDNGLLYPELTIADSIIALRFEHVGRQQRRLLEIRKLRGQSPLLGVHAYRIDQSGVSLYPRFESLPIDALPQLPPARAALGIPGLDSLIGGGLTTSTSTLLIGNPGTGKTLLGLHFLMQGIAQDEDGLLVSFQETEQQLRDKARAFGFDLDTSIATGKLHILRRAPSELNVDEFAQVLRAELLRRPVRRIVFNSIDILERALAWDNRTDDYLATLTEHLRARNVTGLFIVEYGRLMMRELDVVLDTPMSLRENVIFLQNAISEGHWRRILSIPTMRFSDHDRQLHEYSIGPNGFEVGEDSEVSRDDVNNLPSTT